MLKNYIEEKMLNKWSKELVIDSMKGATRVLTEWRKCWRSGIKIEDEDPQNLVIMENECRVIQKEMKGMIVNEVVFIPKIETKGKNQFREVESDRRRTSGEEGNSQMLRNHA